MGQADIGGAMIDAPVLELLKHERTKSLTAREWKHRLAGYGFEIRDVDGAQILSSLTRGIDLGVVPAHAI